VAARALPALVALGMAALITPAVLRALREWGFQRVNYRGANVPFPAGIAVVASAVVALVILAPLQELAGMDVFEPVQGKVVLYVLGVAFLGLVDDVVSGDSRGWRGHGAAILEGRFSTGALKAVGSLGLALYALSGEGLGHGHYLLAVGVLLLATNLFNLLDLRPGRAVKALAILGAGLTLGAMDLHPLAALGLFAAPLLVLGFYDLRELAMLGDTGSNLAGGLAGGWLILTLDETGLAVALALLVLVTAYGEFRSISALIDRVGPLRWLDALGRARA
jgi:UDP-N-acetylmuramyl pentapeptide phosphotransferase/UDP-N-acetylglucosamine-1-phosphate transferase